MNTIKETTQKRFIAWLCALVMAISVIGSLPLQTALAVDAPPNLLGTNSAYYYPDNVINDNMAVSKSPLKRDEKGYYIDWLVSLNVNGKLYEGANQTNHIIVLPNVVKQPERISMSTIGRVEALINILTMVENIMLPRKNLVLMAVVAGTIL